MREMSNQIRQYTHTHTIIIMCGGFSSLLPRREQVGCGRETWGQDLWEAACREKGLGIGDSEHITGVVMLTQWPKKLGNGPG